jgi:hypothetical protein
MLIWSQVAEGAFRLVQCVLRNPEVFCPAILYGSAGFVRSHENIKRATFPSGSARQIKSE